VHDCQCGKIYKHKSSYCKHKRTCSFLLQNDKEEKKEEIVEEKKIDEPDYKELLFEAMKQMQRKDEQVSEAMKRKDEQVSEVMKQVSDAMEQMQRKDEQVQRKDEQVSEAMTELSKMTTENNQLVTKIADMMPTLGSNNTTNNNTTNNKFNLNFFLNTQCKDAMSIQSFMENLSIGSKELEHMGDVGYLNGMIDIFNNTIGNMDIHKRPLHCTDKKREVLYFKQGDEWEKDSTDKQQLKKLIKNVENKNYYNVREWSRAHKESFTSETAAGDQYVKIATEALGGADSSKDSIYLSKIMKHIIREVTVKASSL
jgi:hypothetical protein